MELACTRPSSSGPVLGRWHETHGCRPRRRVSPSLVASTASSASVATPTSPPRGIRAAGSAALHHDSPRTDRGACRRRLRTSFWSSGVVLLHVGPGMTNAATGVATAAFDSVPLLVIAGDVPSYYEGRGPHQEFNLRRDADQVSVYEPFVKRAWRVTRPTRSRASWRALGSRTGGPTRPGIGLAAHGHRRRHLRSRRDPGVATGSADPCKGNGHCDRGRASTGGAAPDSRGGGTRRARGTCGISLNGSVHQSRTPPWVPVCSLRTIHSCSAWSVSWGSPAANRLARESGRHPGGRDPVPGDGQQQLGAGGHVQHSAHSAHSHRHRSVRAGPKLPEPPSPPHSDAALGLRAIAEAYGDATRSEATGDWARLRAERHAFLAPQPRKCGLGRVPAPTGTDPGGRATRDSGRDPRPMSAGTRTESDSNTPSNGRTPS